MADTPTKQDEENGVTKKLTGDLEGGQTLFEDTSIGKRQLTDSEQNKIRLYLYFLMIQITISLFSEIISCVTASYNWAIWGLAIAYFANSTKLYACIQCLVSTTKVKPQYELIVQNQQHHIIWFVCYVLFLFG